MLMATLDLFRHSENARSYAAGDTIVSAGDPGDEMFVIVEGTVDVVVGDHVISLGPGEIIGEMALIDDGHRRAATLRAQTAAKLAPVDRRQFEFLVRNHPSFGLEVMKTMADRLRSMNAKATLG
jgi:CRP-like cAMP-binding protein